MENLILCHCHLVTLSFSALCIGGGLFSKLIMKENSPVDCCPEKYGKRRKLDLDDCPSSGEEIRNRQNLPWYLHHFFCWKDSKDESPLEHDLPNKVDKAAVVFDSGKGMIEELSYATLDNCANLVRIVIEELGLAGNSEFIAVQFSLGIFYPAIILGILRSGNAFYNLDPSEWERAVIAGIGYLNLKYVIRESGHDSMENYGVFALHKISDFHDPKSPLKFTLYEVESKDDCILKRTVPPRNKFAYAIQTSGTTGQRKMVLVPHVCICPNIFDFANRVWKLSREDVVFGAAPSTFDPHIVELFTSLSVGATILYTLAEVKSNGSLLTRLLETHHVSILPITPSLLRRIYGSLTTANGLLLRVITLGGEACPTKDDLRQMTNGIRSISNPEGIILQNVYGVTEVSCWASVTNIDLNSNCHVTIGEGLLDTEVSVVQTDESGEGEGEIMISSSSRICVIIDPKAPTPLETHKMTEGQATNFKFHTGDLGKVTKDGIIFKGRNDRMAKRNGLKIPLQDIESAAISTGLVSYAECKFHKNSIYLIVKLCQDYYNPTGFGEGGTIPHPQDQLSLVPVLNSKLDLPLFMYPDYIVALKSIPLNANGKLDFEYIFKVLDERSQQSNKPFLICENQLLKTIVPIWRSCTWPGLREYEDLLKENFQEVGGDSISAARFVESAFMVLKLFGSEVHQQFEGKILQELLHGTLQSVVNILLQIISSKVPITASLATFQKQFLLEIQSRLCHPLNKFRLCGQETFENSLICSTNNGNCNPVFNSVDPENSNDITNDDVKMKYPVQLVNMYDFKLALCVDASPTIVTSGPFRESVIVGCHGGVLLCVDLSRLRKNPKEPETSVMWRQKFPNRIEASVVIDDSGLFGYVGCHDCKFYKVSLVSGSVICHATCRSSIRSKAAISNKHERIVFLDSGNCVYCVNSHNLNILWVVNSLAFLATTTPEIWRRSCFITTLKNGLVALRLKNGENLGGMWNSLNFSCSSPTVISQNKNSQILLTGTLEGREEGLEARNLNSGSQLWSWTLSNHVALPPVRQPMFSKCCDNLVWISSLNRLIIVPLSFRKFTVQDMFSEDDVKMSPTLCAMLLQCVHQDNSDSSRGACVMFYKTDEERTLRFFELHSGTKYKVKPWFLTEPFKSFSTPQQCHEFIVMGGRDNKLHVIKCYRAASRRC